MDLAGFRASLTAAEPPADLTCALQALWWEAKGDWARAHDCAQAQGDREGAAVHAYLHRVEDDLGNAAYWYRTAGRPRSSVPLAEEWRALAEELLGRS